MAQETDPAMTACRLGPFPPAERVPLAGRTRLYVEIAENDNGELAFDEYDPATGELVESGTIREAA